MHESDRWKLWRGPLVPSKEPNLRSHRCAIIPSADEGCSSATVQAEESGSRLDLKFKKRHSLQRDRIALAERGRTQDSFCDRLYMRRTDRLRQGGDRRVHRGFHDIDGLRRK